MFAVNQYDHDIICRLLDPLMTRQCDEYRRVYADILYAWDLLDKRSEVLKYQTAKLSLNSQVELRSICHDCRQLVKGPSCKDSHCFAFSCSICNLSVRGKVWHNQGTVYIVSMTQFSPCILSYHEDAKSH